MYLWPGLAELWWRGAWSGLALAGAFALVACFAVSATWVWDELLGAGRAGTIWSGFFAAWLGLFVVSLRRAPRGGLPGAGGPDDAFPGALAQYLKGNWLEAETLARGLLIRSPEDVEAALLLTAVLRHTGRIDEGRETLDAVTLWDRAAAWRMEIDREYRLLAETEARIERTKRDESLTDHSAAGSKRETEREVQDDGEKGGLLPELRRAA
jgi:hypothetical protein